jgi:drug/metabolite transporter (DMT)-like permease
MADGALLLVTMGWGLNFVIMKDALNEITPYMYLGIRFILASLILAAVFRRHIKNVTHDELKGGIVIGLCLFGGFVTQTLGLLYTTPAKSGFITSVYVVLVPFMALFLTGQFPGWSQVIGAVITFAGLGITSINRDLTINSGDALTLVCAVFFALQIIYTEQYVKKADPINIAVLQTGITGVLTMAVGLVMEPVPAGMDFHIWAALLYAVIFCTAGAFAIQNTAQKYTTSTHAAVIMGMESVFAGLFSFLLWGETLTVRTIAGFSLIFLGVMITELLPSESRKPRMPACRALRRDAELPVNTHEAQDLPQESAKSCGAGPSSTAK